MIWFGYFNAYISYLYNFYYGGVAYLENSSGMNNALGSFERSLFTILYGYFAFSVEQNVFRVRTVLTDVFLWISLMTQSKYIENTNRENPSRTIVVYHD